MRCVFIYLVLSATDQAKAAREPREAGGGAEGRGGYTHTLPIRVCADQRGRDFKAPGLERGIHLRDVF